MFYKVTNLIFNTSNKKYFNWSDKKFVFYHEPTMTSSAWGSPTQNINRAVKTLIFDVYRQCQKPHPVELVYIWILWISRQEILGHFTPFPENYSQKVTLAYWNFNVSQKRGIFSWFHDFFLTQSKNFFFASNKIYIFLIFSNSFNWKFIAVLIISLSRKVFFPFSAFLKINIFYIKRGLQITDMKRKGPDAENNILCEIFLWK